MNLLYFVEICISNFIVVLISKLKTQANTSKLLYKQLTSKSQMCVSSAIHLIPNYVPLCIQNHTCVTSLSFTLQEYYSLVYVQSFYD